MRSLSDITVDYERNRGFSDGLLNGKRGPKPVLMHGITLQAYEVGYNQGLLARAATVYTARAGSNEARP